MFKIKIPGIKIKRIEPEPFLRLNNYNNWHFLPGSGVTQAEKLEVLSRYDNVCFTELWGDVSPQTIQSLNPQAKVYRVYTLLTKPSWDGTGDSRIQFPISRRMIEENDWWLRDGDGNIVKDSESVWMVDIGKAGVKEVYLKNVLERLDGKGFDGVVLDHWTTALTTGYLGKYLTGSSMPDTYPTDEVWFTQAWQPFIEYVTAGLRSAGYRIIGNCVGEYQNSNPRQEWQRSRVDAAIYELWAFNSRGEWLPGNMIERRIQAMGNDPMEVWTADFGLRNSDPEYERKQTVALAMYYIAVPANSFNRSYHHYGDGKIDWETIWDFKIGTPIGIGQKMPGRYCWSREFTHGLVLLNYEESAEITYTLEGTYRDHTGGTYSGAVTLPPHTALILTSSRRIQRLALAKEATHA